MVGRSAIGRVRYLIVPVAVNKIMVLPNSNLHLRVQNKLQNDVAKIVRPKTSSSIHFNFSKITNDMIYSAAKLIKMVCENQVSLDNLITLHFPVNGVASKIK